MLIPTWVLVTLLAAIVVLLATSIAAAIVCWGLTMELREARADRARLRIKVYDRRDLPLARVPRP